MLEDMHIKLRKTRKEMGLTQKEAAKEIGISRVYYSYIENAKKIPSLRLLMKMNDVFKILK